MITLTPTTLTLGQASIIDLPYNADLIGALRLRNISPYLVQIVWGNLNEYLIPGEDTRFFASGASKTLVLTPSQLPGGVPAPALPPSSAVITTVFAINDDIPPYTGPSLGAFPQVSVGNLLNLANQGASFVCLSNLVLNTTTTITLPGAAGRTTCLMGFHLTSTVLSSGVDYYEVIVAGIAGVGSDQYTVTANTTQGAQLIVSFAPYGLPANGLNSSITVQCSHAAANATWYTIGAYGYQI